MIQLGGREVLFKCEERMNLCIESSVDVLRSEGAPYRIQGGMRDIGLHFSGYGLGLHDDPSEEIVHEDSGAESESTEVAVAGGGSSDCFPPTEDNDAAVTIAEDGVVSVTVGLPRRFGNPEVTEAPETDATAPPGEGSLREILRKVTVNEIILRSAIDSLGGGVEGLKAVVGYVKHFQETRDPNAEVNPDDFTRGLEEFCMLQETSKGEYVVVSNPQGASSEYELPHLNNNHSVELNRQSSLQMQRDDQWSSQRNGQSHADMYTMGYVDNMSGYFPNFCYPYPPPFHAGYNPFNMGVRPMYVPMMGLPYFPPSHEFVPRTTDAITRASRKSRIARRRGQGTESNANAAAAAYHPRPPKIVHAGAGSVQPQESTSHAVSSSGQMAQGVTSRDLMLVLQKQLSPSGVSSLGRIVLPKKEAETHLPHLVASEGVLLTMTDYDTAQSWTFRYRFWANNKSRMYLLENTRDFVKAHNLQERDMLSLYRDAQGSYVVRGERNSSHQTGDGTNETAGEEMQNHQDDQHQHNKKHKS